MSEIPLGEKPFQQPLHYVNSARCESTSGEKALAEVSNAAKTERPSNHLDSGSRQVNFNVATLLQNQAANTCVGNKGPTKSSSSSDVATNDDS